MNATTPTQERNRAVWIWVLLAASAAIIYIYFAAGGRSSPRGTTGPMIGHKLGYLELEPLTGASKSVSIDDLAGRVTLINFWGTWCGPCNLEFPHLLELAAQFEKNDAFRVYPVSCGVERDDADLAPVRDETEAFLKARQTSIPTYADQNAASRRALVVELDLAGGQFAYPTTVILDRTGRIRGFWVGYDQADTAEMRSLIKDLLGNEPTRAAAG